jgi:hypothetical protein
MNKMTIQKKEIVLDFGSILLDAELFDTSIALRFAENMPYTIELEKWGNELYGSIGIDVGEEDPVSDIPPGGIAYTNRGNYVCIFFGQKPAWNVEYIGKIKDSRWKVLLENTSCKLVTVRSQP